MNVDELTGVELRKAVAEAVGWEWYDNPKSLAPSHAIQSGMKIRLKDNCFGISWDDAIAACEAAGIWGDAGYIVACDGGDIVIKNAWVEYETLYAEIARADGCTPESLCRALLKALEAKDDA